MEVEPFRIDVAEEVLEDLRERIRRTRWPDQIPGVGWEQGTELANLRDLLGYWANGFDWRARELELNRLSHFRAELDGLRIHFVHQSGTGSDRVPLIVTHGWPSSFLEMLRPRPPSYRPPALTGSTDPRSTL